MPSTRLTLRRLVAGSGLGAEVGDEFEQFPAERHGPDQIGVGGREALERCVAKCWKCDRVGRAAGAR